MDTVSCDECTKPAGEVKLPCHIKTAEWSREGIRMKNELIGILAIVGILLLTMSFADGIAEHSKRETVERMNASAVLVANNSENHLVPVVTPLDSGTGYLGDITIQGTVISKFDRIGG